MVGAGAGYLALCLATSVAAVLWLRKGKRACGRFVDRGLRLASTGGVGRFIAGPWFWRRSERDRLIFWHWLPAAFGLPILAILFAASSASEFVR
jgi:hypothetical protein